MASSKTAKSTTSATRKDTAKKNNKMTAKKKTRTKTKTYKSFSLYIHKVLKHLHPNLEISKQAMNIMNSFVSDIYERITIEFEKLLKISNRSTISADVLHSSVRLLVPGELGSICNKESKKAMIKYNHTMR